MLKEYLRATYKILSPSLAFGLLLVKSLDPIIGNSQLRAVAVTSTPLPITSSSFGVHFSPFKLCRKSYLCWGFTLRCLQRLSPSGLKHSAMHLAGTTDAPAGPSRPSSSRTRTAPSQISLPTPAPRARDRLCLRRSRPSSRTLCGRCDPAAQSLLSRI